MVFARVRPRFVALLLITLMACATCAPTDAHAAITVTPNPAANLDGSVVVSPAAQRISTTEPNSGTQIGPNMTVTRELVIMHRGRQRATFALDIATIVGSTAEEVVEVRSGVRTGAAEWASVERPTITLNPGDTATIPVTIRIPRLVKPGSSSFAVTVTQQSAQTEVKGAGVTPVFRQVAIFIVDLPGDAPVSGRIVSARISSADDVLREVRGDKPRNRNLFVGSHTLRMAIVYGNDGQRVLQPSGAVRVRDLFGREATRYSINRFTVYPEGENAVQFDMTQLPAFGVFIADLSLSSEAGKQRRSLGWIIMVPTWLAFTLGGMLLILVGWTIRRIRARRRAAVVWGEELDDEQWDDGDDGHPELHH